MKKYLTMLSYVLGCLMACVISLTACNEEDFEALLTPIPEAKDYKSFADRGIGYAFMGLTLDGDTVVYLEVRLKETTIEVSPEELLHASLLQDLPIQKNESSGLITADQTFLSDDGQESYLHLEAKAPEHLLELVKLKSGYKEYRFDWKNPTAVPIGNMAMLTEHIKPMLLDENGESLGDIPSLEPWYYHTTLDEPEPHIPVIKADTAYFWENGEAFWRFRGTIDDKVFLDKVFPLASTGGFYGTDVWHAVAPARFDASVGNNGLLITIEPQPERSYTEKVLDEYTTASLSYNCCRISTTLIGDGEGTSATECVIDSWVMSYTITVPNTDWSMSTHPIQLTHEVTKNELTQVDGTRNDRYGKPHHEIGDLETEETCHIVINGVPSILKVSKGTSHICEWRERMP